MSRGVQLPDLRCAVDSHLDLTLHAATAFRSPSLEERYPIFGSSANGKYSSGNQISNPKRSFCLNVGSRVHNEDLTSKRIFFLNQLTEPCHDHARYVRRTSGLDEYKYWRSPIVRLWNFQQIELAVWSVLKTSLRMFVDKICAITPIYRRLHRSMDRFELCGSLRAGWHDEYCLFGWSFAKQSCIRRNKHRRLCSVVSVLQVFHGILAGSFTLHSGIRMCWQKHTKIIFQPYAAS